MAEGATVRDLFDLAIHAEQTAEAIYHRLAEMFAHHAAAHRFWTLYEKQEAQHARWLCEIRDAAPQADLAAPADPAMIEDLRRVSDLRVDNLLAPVRTLEDAYLLVVDLENSETNAVFEFLVDRFAQDTAAHTFLRAQLNDHISRLMDEFAAQVGDASVRRSVQVQR